MNEIKLGEMKMIQTKDLCFALGNRETYDAHINKFESLLSDYGFLDALKVIPSDDCFLIVEGQHRFEAGKRLGMEEFPCYVIDWLEGCDEDEIQNIIISLNANNKTWTIYDYVKSFADRGDEDYKTLKAMAHEIGVPVAYFFCESESTAELLCLLEKMTEEEKTALVQKIKSD